MDLEQGITPEDITSESRQARPQLNAFQEIRSENGFSENGIWSDARIETASQGLEQYGRIYEQASGQLREYLRQPYVIQTFTGVRPVTSLANENASDGSIKANEWDKKQTFPDVKDELSKLLDEVTNGSLRVARIDYTKVKYKGNYSYELMHESALRNVARENPDLFPGEVGNYIEWLVDHPEAWPGTPDVSEESRLSEIRYGVISGFPRSACEKYAAFSTSGLDLVKTLKTLLFRKKGQPMDSVRKVEHTPLRTTSVSQAITESGLPYMHYDETDLRWTREAAALLKHGVESFVLPEPKQ